MSTEGNKKSEMPVPKIKHDWYQTEVMVVVEVRLKGCRQEDLKVDFSATSLSLSVKMPEGSGSGSEYSLELDLAHPVIPEQCQARALSSKIEIKMKKAEGIRWNELEGDGSQPLASAGAGKTSTDPKKYPSSKGKDWDRIGAEIEKVLEEDKPQGDQALNEMFQKIYSEGSDEVKRAMNKSFSESGGTVLSTNWNEIGKAKTEVKPPDGMEFKKWDS